MPDSRQWKLEGFLERLDAWVAQEQPDEATRIAVTSWIFSRFTDPYGGVRREPNFANLWYGPVPNTASGGSVVQCAYWIFESTRTVRCDSFATLSRPL